MQVHTRVYMHESRKIRRRAARTEERKNNRRTSYGRREVWRDQASQAMLEARLWLRDHLGRQAEGGQGGKGEEEVGGRRVGCRRAKRGGVRGEGDGIEGAPAYHIPAGRRFSNMATRVNVGPRPIL